MAAAGGAGAGAAGGAMLDALVDWSKVSKDMMTCRDLYTAHLQSPIAELVRAFAGHRDIGLLQALPPLPLVPEDSESEDDYGAEDALAALAYERAKADAKVARENEAQLREAAELALKKAEEAEAAKWVDRPPPPPGHPPLSAFLDTADKRALKQVSPALSAFTKLRMVRVKVRDVNTRRANRLKVFCQLREMIGVDLGVRGVKRLSLGVASLPVLLSLNLGGNAAQNEGVMALAGALPACPWLRHLNLSSNAFDDDGAVPLAEACSQCKHLVLMDLSRNQIGDDGAVAIAKRVIPTCRQLAKLNLYRNNVHDTGAAAFSRALPQTTSLTSLDLRHNHLTVAGCKKLSGAVPFCTVKTTLKHTNVAMDMKEYMAVKVKYLPSEEEVAAKKAAIEAAKKAEQEALEKAEFDAYVAEQKARAAASKAAREKRKQHRPRRRSLSKSKGDRRRSISRSRDKGGRK